MSRKMRLQWLYGIAFALLFFTLPNALAGTAEQVGAFRYIGAFKAAGAVTGSVRGASPLGSGRALYTTQTYWGNGKGFSFSMVDPETGKSASYPNPVKTETTAYGLVAGPNGNLYMGTVPNAHLYRFDTRTQTLADLGIPIPGENFVWDLAVAENGKIYGVTYPHCGLFSYDPKTGVTSDLGRMSRNNEYGRYIVAGDDGYLYIGTGSTHAGIVAYDIKTGKSSEIVPQVARGVGYYHVAMNKNGVIYASGPDHMYRMAQGRAVEISKAAFHEIMEAYTPKTLPKTAPSQRNMPIFRLAAGPGGVIYGSTILPMYIFSMDVASGKFQNLGEWGNGEAYSLLWNAGHLLIGAYGAKTPLLTYNPGESMSGAGNQGRAPSYVSYSGADEGWRPMAMAVGDDNKAYVGAVAGTGSLNGQFAIWDPRSGQVRSTTGLIPEQSVVSLAMGANGIVYGGTSVIGGSGTTPSQKSAVLFGLDTHSNKVLWKIVPIQGAQGITDLIVASSGQLFGFAGHTLFEYSPSTGKLTRLSDVNYGGLIYNCVATSTDGRVYGLATKGIFEIDPGKGTSELIATSPKPITAGGALVGRKFYFASGGDVYEYTLPH